MSFTIQLKPSNSEKLFEIQSDEVVHSSTLRIMVEDFEDEIKSKKIAFPVEVEELYLEKIVEWLKENKNEPVELLAHDWLLELTPWDNQFFGSMNEPGWDVLGSLVNSANMLGMNLLAKKACKWFAEQLNGLNVEEMREVLGFVNDLTPEQEEMNRQEFGWMEDNN